MGLQYSLTAIGSTVLQSAVNTLTGQNLGAQKYTRIRTGVKQGLLICLLFAIAALTIVTLWSGSISQLFIDASETALLDHVEYYLFRNGIFYFLLALLLILRNTLQGMGYAPLAMSAGVMEMIARSVVAIGFIPTLGFNAVCFANPAAWFPANVFLVPAYIYTYKQLQHRRSIHR